ncbi:related to erv1 protein, mitochondrial precursor [Serendipita indica DSM 11827]|uniref:Sulfhydryl oxidase n=1 Tax=Serendipita indica (strain DSM 11827) TaxID=1109443 RepID=G4T812_SERID|nr:related to erv1 protein, mitochondrial precursor [Serendipita indica DSM 11827]
MTTEPPKTGQRLPPGMVMGPDGKPCKACTSLESFSSAAGTRTKSRAKPLTAAGVAGASLAKGPLECPPGSEQIGRATWTFLHTAAAYYPVNPTPQHQRSMLSLLQSLSVLYPCSYCAQHLGGEMQKNPPNVSGRVQLSKWLCDVHNEVNERLGKDKFDCSRVLERWKDGPADGSCD